MGRLQVRELNRSVAGVRQRVDPRQALIDLAERSLRFGHRRLAVRRYLMLQACGHDVPPVLAERCAPLLKQVDPRDLKRIRESVAQWHRMVAPGPMPQLRPEPVAPPSAFATLQSVWR